MGYCGIVRSDKHSRTHIQYLLMSKMSYTARNASRYKLSEYNWLAWSRSYGCAPDVNAQSVCAVQGPGRWRHRASAAAVGSEMRRRRVVESSAQYV